MKPFSKHPLPQVRLSCPLSLLAAVLLAGLITLLALWCQPNSFRGVVLPCLLRTPVLILLNALPVGLLLLFFAFLSSNVFYGAALANLIVCGLSIVNRIKIEVRDEPLFPRDFALLKEAADAAASYSIRYPLKFIAAVIAVTLALAALGLVCKHRPFPASRLRGWAGRLLGAAVSMGLLALLIATAYRSDTPLNDFLTKGISVSNPYRLSTVFNETGFPLNFCQQFTTYTVDRPEGYSRSAAEGWDQGGQPANPPAVHVIMVMDEAFSDITDEPVFTYAGEDDPLPNLHALRRDGHCLSGRVVVPGFAGGTANTEFDVLTGMQSNALSATATSAMRVVNRNLDSLIRLFREDGSHTSFFHPGDDWFYNRENVYRWLGAEETIFRDQMEDVRFKGGGTWVSDDYVAELIERKFREAVSEGQTLFNYTTTIQNHMSYVAEKYGPDYDFPPLQTSAALSEEAETLLEVYVEGARDADAMLGRLWRFFSRREEPVVLVFFGDHLPYLGDNQLAYRELGLDVGPAEDGRVSLRSYETPCVIWANDAAARALDWESAAASLDLPEDGVISACYLGAVLAELTGRSGESPWFDFLNRLRREAPVVQQADYVAPDGSAFTEPGPELAADILKWRQWSFYKLQHKEIP